MSSGKFLELDGVYHVPNVRKNLISMTLLDHHGHNVNFGSNKVVIGRYGQFVGRGVHRSRTGPDRPGPKTETRPRWGPRTGPF